MARRKQAQPQFKKISLGNDLTVLLERNVHAMGLSIGIWVKAGTRDEKLNEAGISHFLEHMVFKGTERRRADEITRSVERVGGEFNAFTAREYTCFHLMLLKRDFELGMDILSDVVTSSIFDGVEFDREKKVILQEIAMVEDTPEEVAQDLYFELIYGKHGLGRNILGTTNSIRKMKRGDLIRYFRRYYRPENLVISVAGDITEARLKRALSPLKKKIWPGRTQRSVRQERVLKRAPAIRDGVWWKVDQTEQAHIVWGVGAPEYASRDQAAALLIANYLGGGMSSKLFQEIREKSGLAYTVYASQQAFIDSGVMTIYAATSPGQVSKCLGMIEDAALALCAKELTPEEIREVKESIKGALLLSSDSVESTMTANAIDEIYFGKYYSIADICREVDEITARDVIRVARKIFGAGKRSILVYGPKPTAAMRKRLQPKIIR